MLANTKERFLKIYEDSIKREGSTELLRWLEDSDFFVAPASTKYHGCHEGGLIAIVGSTVLRRTESPKICMSSMCAVRSVKTVSETGNKNHLLKAKTIAEEMELVEGVGFGLIYDKCLIELAPKEEDGATLTGIWFAPLDDERTHAISNYIK